MNGNTCRCGKPTRDQAYVCQDCGDKVSRALGDVAWLEEELETTNTRAKGIDYRTVGGTKSDEKPLPFNAAASGARDVLRAVLVSWVRFCHEEGVRHQSPRTGLPEDTLVAMSRWLLWRIDGLTLVDIGSEAVDEITEAVAKCHRLIDSPQAKQYLGECGECPTGRLYVVPGQTLARCNVCGETRLAEELRAKALESLDDKLCTAGEIGELSTYFGLKANRDQVRKHVEYLSRQGRIAKHPAISTQAVYRFGEVYPHLIQKDYGKRKSA